LSGNFHRITGAHIPGARRDFGKRLRDTNAKFEISHRAGVIVSRFYARFRLGFTSLPVPVAGNTTNNNIEARGDSVPVVAGFRMTIGWDPLATADGASDLSGFLPPGGCRFFACRRNRGPDRRL
jgi:hypothetical protein